jgi:hypothetical protein
MHKSWLITAVLLPLVGSAFRGVLLRHLVFPVTDALDTKVRTVLARRAGRALARHAPAKERFEAAVTTLIRDPRAENRVHSEVSRFLIADSVFFLTSVILAVSTFVFDAMNQKALAAILYLAMLATQLMFFFRARRRFRLEAILREVSKRSGTPL